MYIESADEPHTRWKTKGKVGTSFVLLHTYVNMYMNECVHRKCRRASHPMRNKGQGGDLVCIIAYICRYISCTIVVHSYRALLPCTIIGHYRRAQLSCTIVVHNYRALSSCTTILHYCRAQLSCTIVVHNYRAIGVKWCNWTLCGCDVFGGRAETETRLYLSMEPRMYRILV